MNHLEALFGDLARVFLRSHRLLDRRMTAEGASLARTKLLLYLEGQEGEARAADIAEFFGLAPRTVTEALDGLERDGMVRREPDPQDRRVKRLSITGAGLAATAATEPLRVALVEQIFGVLDAKERKQLEAILAKLAAAIREQESGKAG
jgi:DNA-binding MarR family transcriptional regulator